MGDQLFGSKPLERVKAVGTKGGKGREVPRDDVKGNTISSQVLNDRVHGDDDLKEDKNKPSLGGGGFQITEQF